MKELHEINTVYYFGTPQAAVLMEGPKDLIEKAVALLQNIDLIELASLTKDEYKAHREYQVEKRLDTETELSLI